MIKKGWQQLRQQKKNGISMAVVLCVSALFVAFAAAILYTAGMLTAQSNLRLKQERCSQLAKSAADVLDQELQKLNSDYEAKRLLSLERLRLHIARPGLFNDWLKEKGKLGGQHKVPRLSNTREYIEAMLVLNNSAHPEE